MGAHVRRGHSLHLRQCAMVVVDLLLPLAPANLGHRQNANTVCCHPPPLGRRMYDGTRYHVMYKARTLETSSLRGTEPSAAVPPLWWFDMADVVILSVLGGARIFL
jgi:hypothetical protein